MFDVNYSEITLLVTQEVREHILHLPQCYGDSVGSYLVDRLMVTDSSLLLKVRGD